MFQKLFVFLLISISLNCVAQDVSVEKSIFGIQTGLVGVWVNNEFKLSNQFTFRSEIGLELGAIRNSSNGIEKTTYVMAPVVSVEPRWYYNLEKRNAKGKNIKNNSGNLFSIKANYNPDLFLITNNKNLNVVNQLAIVPEWGIRRVYGKHFSFETGFGLGPILYFGKDSENVTKKEDVYVDLHLRIGYSF